MGLNDTLFQEQISHYRKTGQWRTRIVSKLKTPFYIAHKDGPKQVTDGRIVGLVHVVTTPYGRRYTDLRSGGHIASVLKGEIKPMENAMQHLMESMIDNAIAFSIDGGGVVKTVYLPRISEDAVVGEAAVAQAA
jgi:hypothetical protein